MSLTKPLSIETLYLAMDSLASGGIIAYPTEAVYGLGCDAFCAEAVDRLLALKQRPWHKGLIVVAANIDQIGPLLNSLPAHLIDHLAASWPGPTTWVIPDPNHVMPQWIRGHHESVAVRISNHPVVQQLCDAWGAPLVSTSANYSGKQSIRSGLVLHKQIQRGQWSALDYIVNGQCLGHSNPSEIKDLLSGKTLRASS